MSNGPFGKRNVESMNQSFNRTWQRASASRMQPVDVAGCPIRLLRRHAIRVLAHFVSGLSSLIGRANVLVQSKKVARVEFGLKLPQPFERFRIICGLHAIRALVTQEI